MKYEEIIAQILHKIGDNVILTFGEVLGEYSKGEAGILAYLKFEKNDATPGELSKKFNVTSARIASILKSLENKSLVMRRTNQTDKRKTFVTITAKGEEVVERTKKRVADKISVVFNELGEEDTKEYIRLIVRISDILKKSW